MEQHIQVLTQWINNLEQLIVSFKKEGEDVRYANGKLNALKSALRSAQYCQKKALAVEEVSQ